MSNPLLVGVDVHRKRNAVCVMDDQGQELIPRFTMDNNRPGTEAFVHQMAQLMLDGDFDVIQVAAEATGWYWFHFFQTLSQDPFLNQWPLELYPLNPRLTANFKKTYMDLDHTDPIDAFVVADRLRLGRDLPAPFRYEETYLPLRFLTRYRYHVVHNLAREKAYCLAVLYLKASEYTHPDKKKRPFSNVFGAASRAVLQEFGSIEEIATIPFDELVEFIDLKGKRRFPNPTENARKLQQVARTSYTLPEALQQPINLVLDLSLKHIAFLERQEKRLNTAIAECMEAIPHTLDTIPGFGPVFSGGIISEIAGIERFDYNQSKVAKFAGLKWRKHRSADFEADETRLTRTGNRYLRYYLCEAAQSVRLRDAEYAAYYERKYHEARKHQHKRAIVLTARKLVRLVTRLLTTNQPYQPRRR
ncbi:MAG: IS110 family transposase [Chloroflexi bacterium]|nr:IS110 family transposase [Chloroflexota bacterium]